MKDWICYFSKNDLSLGHYLAMSEKRIMEVSEGEKPTNLSETIELWHIWQMFENGCRLVKWTDEYFEQLKGKTCEYKSFIAQFFNNLTPNRIRDEYESLGWEYKKTFWEIIEAFKLYKLIESETLCDIAKSNVNNLCYILACKGLVEKFKVELYGVLLNDAQSAHILLDVYVKKKDSSDRILHLPSNLTLEDKEQIINNYLDSDNPNLNYVRLILQVKDNKKQFIISPKIRLKAERLTEKLNNDFLNSSRTETVYWSVGIQFTDEENVYPVDVMIDEGGNPTYCYSLKYIKSCDNLHRIANCISLFGWINKYCLLNLISKEPEVGTMEALFIDNGRYSYPSYMFFNQKNKLALSQLYMYDVALRKMNSSFEKELKQFYEIYLQEKYGYPGLSINFPNGSDSSLNKCRILCPELDAVVKQYTIFVEYDGIDKDLIRLSKPLKVEEEKSLLTNKYYEIVGGCSEIRTILLGLFGSGNSLLSHVRPFEKKHYKSFISLLENEKGVLYSNYREYQKPHLDFLIEKGLIAIDSNGVLYIVDERKIEVLKCLWEFGVCSYWHYDDFERQFLDEMFSKGWLIRDDHLLSRPERDYFSYYLDNMKYTNGKAYRNHYSHGSSSPVDNEEEHFKAYNTFLMLLTIVILKIENDLWLAKRAIAIDAAKRQKYVQKKLKANENEEATDDSGYQTAVLTRENKSPLGERMMADAIANGFLLEIGKKRSYVTTSESGDS